MTPEEVDRWRLVDALFEEALALPASERAAFVAARSAGDEVLRRQVEALIQAQHAADDFLEAPPLDLLDAATAATPTDAASLAERRLGPYRLLREIGQGGMGEVYLAERADGQFVQRVAVKRIRGGFAFTAAHDRFRLERQILARLEHPHITRLIDGGVDDEGCPYLVMEYVEGVPLTDYCDAHRLPVERRLALFRTVCEAVHYAHQNLVIHRDLKPSNILVTESGQVKLLDFGIAKLLDQGGAEDAFPLVVTQSDVRLMTPGYASPEQVRGEPVTTASDVYALGVILYELLTGRLPYRLTGRLLHEVQRVICEAIPEKPSTAVVRPHVAASPEAVGQARATTIERLRRRLRGDLDTIVLMALRKEPERRYASAEQLAEDVERYLSRRPVRAQKDTVAYRAAKFVRRNVLGVAAAVAVVLALVGGLGAATWQARIATREAAKARHINDFLLDMLSSADPNTTGHTLTVAEALDAAAEEVDTKLRSQPEVEADVRSTLGKAYLELGLYDKAALHLNRAIELRRRLAGPAAAETAFEMNLMGTLLNRQGRLDEAEEVFRQALAIERRALAHDDPHFGQLLNNFALNTQEQGRYEEADSLYRAALAILRKDTTLWDSEISSTVNNHATLLHAMGRLPEAEASFREVLAKDRRVYPADHYGIGILLNNLSQVLQLEGKYAEAEPMAREALSIYRNRLGPDHPEVALAAANLASLLQDLGRPAEAEPLFRQALDIQRRVLGTSHTDLGQTLNNFASLLQEQNRFDEAEALQREAITVMRAALGEEHPLTAIITANMGRVLYYADRPAEAEPYYQQALPILRETLQEHPYLAKALVGLGLVLVERGRAAEAEPLLREGLRIRQAALAEGDWQIAQAQSGLGDALARLGRLDEARPLLAESHATLLRQRGTDDFETRRARSRMEEAGVRR